MRERLVVPPAAADVEKLAARYSFPALGVLSVRGQDGATIFDFDFVVGERDGKRVLVIRDAQHEYPLIKSPSP